ncbi:hypothetical protein D9757_005938 [Collybiopsis confluens]|uniref:Uncharacterized protein n=1 Tax=Collybiopsis confluens TaxID=2823264 RepID=A0A8H5MA88_9AGAR|nr:hypothetical protein D9757_005938 [Collybiopsis confluens]
MSDGLSESSSNVMPLLAEMLTVMRSMHELMKIQGEHRKVSVDNFPKSIFRPPPPDNNKAHPSGTQETQTISPVIIEREMDSPADQDFELSALTWLKRSTSSPSAKEIIVQSLGAFCPAMTSKIRKESSLFYDGYRGLYFWEKLQNPNHSDHWDNLEPLLRATVHMDDNILIIDYEPHCNIQEALVLLAHGVQIVSHAHYADRDMTLTRTNVLSHFLALYTQGNFNEDVQVKMPTLVSFALFNQAEKLDMRKSYPDYFGHG